MIRPYIYVLYHKQNLYSNTAFFYIDSSANSRSAPTNLVKPVHAQASSQQKDVDTARAIVNSTSNQITVFLKKAKLQFEHWSPEPMNRKRKLVDDDAIVTNPKKIRQDYGLPVQFVAKVPKY